MRYHPPRQEWVSERDFELYSGVVSMGYRLHDRMLGTLIEKARRKAGDDLTVIQWPNRHDMSSLRLLGSVGEPINPAGSRTNGP